MAGWLKRVDGSCPESFKVRLSEGETKPWFDQEPVLEWAFGSKEEAENDCDGEKLKSLFNGFLTVFLEAICGARCFRPLPPILGDGQSVDLFKLYLNVRERGGFEKVSENGQWDCVARECGFDTIVGSCLKLIYVKYLGALSRYLERVFKVRNQKSGIEQSGSGFLCRLLMDLESDLKGRLSGISHKREKNVGLMDVEFNTELGFQLDGKLPRFDERGGCVKLNGIAEILEKKGFVAEPVEECNENVFSGKANTDDEDKVFVVDIGQLKRTNDTDTDTILDSCDGKVDVHSRKRKQEDSYNMLNWIKSVAMDPCNPATGSIPDSSKWKYHANDLVWKKVLRARQQMQWNGKNESSDQQATFQKKQKMHPTMYDDQSERQRFSQRLLAAKEPSRKSGARIRSETSSSATWSDDDLFESQSESSGDSDANFLGGSRRKKRIPVGPSFQADVPEWAGKICESDSKWLGTRLWPLERVEQNRNLIERERVGKGRQESCGCQFPGSFECIRFHISEKRIRLKLELGPAFYRMKFDNMGEEIAASWTKEEQKKFHHIVESNPFSLGKFFWDEVMKSFASRGRKSVVSYYYNVFLLRRRGQQNRMTPHDINSDDDESGAGYNTAISPGSIFCSPKKSVGKVH